MYGHPIRIRSDYAAEHSLVRADQERARPDVIKPFLTGSSVHNQVSCESSVCFVQSNVSCSSLTSLIFLILVIVLVEDRALLGSSLEKNGILLSLSIYFDVQS